MATRSAIGIYKNGKIKSIYNHFDGDIKVTGNLLYTYYNNETLINELLNKGSVRALEASIEDTEFLGDKADIFNSLDEYIKESHRMYDAEYIYVFKDKEWYVYLPDKKQYKSLKDLIQSTSDVKEKNFVQVLDIINYYIDSVKNLKNENLQNKSNNMFRYSKQLYSNISKVYQPKIATNKTSDGKFQTKEMALIEFNQLVYIIFKFNGVKEIFEVNIITKDNKNVEIYTVHFMHGVQVTNTNRLPNGIKNKAVQLTGKQLK